MKNVQRMKLMLQCSKKYYFQFIINVNGPIKKKSSIYFPSIDEKPFRADTAAVGWEAGNTLKRSRQRQITVHPRIHCRITS